MTDRLREALEGGALALLRRAKYGERADASLVYDAARAVVDADKAWLCEEHRSLSDNVRQCFRAWSGQSCRMVERLLVDPENLK